MPMLSPILSVNSTPIQEFVQAQGDAGPVPYHPPQPGGQQRDYNSGFRDFLIRNLGQIIVNPPVPRVPRWRVQAARQEMYMTQNRNAYQVGINIQEPAVQAPQLPSVPSQELPSQETLSSETNTFDHSFIEGFTTLCIKCCEDRKASSKCYECNEFLCPSCIEEHKATELGKDHHILSFDQIANRTGVQPNTQSQASSLNPQPGPSGYTPPSSRVVGAGRGSTSPPNPDSRTASGSSDGDLESFRNAIRRRTSNTQVRTFSLSDADIVAFQRLFSQTNSNFTVNPSVPQPPGTPSPQGSIQSNASTTTTSALTGVSTSSSTGPSTFITSPPSSQGLLPIGSSLSSTATSTFATSPPSSQGLLPISSPPSSTGPSTFITSPPSSQGLLPIGTPPSSTGPSTFITSPPSSQGLLPIGSSPSSTGPSTFITSPPSSQALLPIGSPPSNQAGPSTEPCTSSASQELVDSLTRVQGQGDAGYAGNANMALAVPESVVLPLCVYHQMDYRFFCNSCMVPVCNLCVRESHNEHSLIPISDGLDRAHPLSKELNDEIRNLNTGIRQTLDNLQRMCEGIDIKAQQAAYEVRSSIRKFIQGLEAREQELLRKIEQARQVKLRIINFQMDNIRQHYYRLARASDVIHDTRRFSNNYEIMSANYQAFTVLRQARNIGPGAYPCEDDAIMFVPPHETFLNSIANLGQLTISSSPPSNSIRLYKQPLLHLNSSLTITELPATRYRPIYGCPDIVAIQDFGRMPSKVWGRRGSNIGDVLRPWGIAINKFRQIIISDRSNNRIQIFDTEGNYIFHFGSEGNGPGEFVKPASVTINSNDDIIVADKDNHRIQVFNRFGEFLLTFGEKGHQIGQFNYPWDVAVDSVGNILVSDTRNHRIQLFKWNGVFITKWGGDGFGSVGRLFDSPRGVTFDPHGNILVTDFNLHKVVIIERSTGRIRMIGREGGERGQFFRPQGIVCDDRGWFIVADSRNYRFQVFNERAEFMWSVGKFGKEDPGDFDRPSDMCIDPEGHIHLIDFGNDRIQVF